MNKIGYVFFIMFCIFGILFLCCGRDIEKQKVDFDADKLMEDVWKPDRNKVALLSLKYNIELLEVDKLLGKYLGRTGSPPDLEDILKVMQKPRLEKMKKIHERVIELSNDFGIQKEILASLIIDYQIWSRCEEASISY